MMRGRPNYGSGNRGGGSGGGGERGRGGATEEVAENRAVSGGREASSARGEEEDVAEMSILNVMQHCIFFISNKKCKKP
jgi:hypothetical protein